MDYYTLNYSQVKKYIPEAKAQGVSEVARSKGQFVDQLSKVGSVSKLPQDWKSKRENFIARTLPAYQSNPTYRRWLSLVMWGAKPKGKKPKP